ncbi:hypothetical protein [Amycolatopsis sp. DG1A-15b]|uniref:hypothetical protein n=1 Tax=Amycolatopsis sp. DG1A-15b TaxID=3052846 RepID=UPI00255B564A|nr:hypothetical protein [Amycolatopsis sp. DG1A-15b]WIX86883.1 hypothetical protein QRY02_37825 [Amycolatopsis sp. DG1A-15b]
MGRTLSRVAGIVSAGALITFAAAPAALAQDETTTPETTTTTSPSETTTTTAPTSTETTAPVTTTGTTTAAPTSSHVTTTTPPKTTSSAPETTEPPKDDYQDNTGHGFIGLGGEGVLVIACAAGKPGEVATQYLSVTGGPDQDEADGRLWNYSVRVADAPAGTTTAKFSWTCAGVEGNGTVEFEQEQQPPTSTVTATSTPSSSAPSSSTAPLTTAPSTTATSTTPAGNAAPKAQVKVAPKGGVETGFGGTAW